MKLYYSKIESRNDCSPLMAAVPAEKLGRLSANSPGILQAAFAYSLLAYGVFDHFHTAPLPAISFEQGGKPYFSEIFDMHFSISHTKTHVLCALDSAPIGVDVETMRAIDPKIYRRVLADDENPRNFFSYWSLKESLIKLLGKKPAPFAAIRFRIYNNMATSCMDGINCALYTDIPGCAAAVCSYSPIEARSIEFVPLDSLTDYISALK